MSSIQPKGVMTIRVSAPAYLIFVLVCDWLVLLSLISASKNAELLMLLSGKGAVPVAGIVGGELARLAPALRVGSSQWRKQADDPDAYLQRG